MIDNDNVVSCLSRVHVVNNLPYLCIFLCDTYNNCLPDIFVLSTTIYVYFLETFIKGWHGHALPGDAGLIATVLHANNLYNYQYKL